MTDDPLAVDIAEIPLPDGDVLAAMLAEEAAADEAAAAPPVAATKDVAATKAAKQVAESPEVAALSFVGGRPRAVAIPLDFPFEFDGRTVEAVTVRRLTVSEVGRLTNALPERFDNFEVYAAMTDLSAAVLRGLDEADGARVSAAAYDFLPRAFRPADAP